MSQPHVFGSADVHSLGSLSGLGVALWRLELATNSMTYSDEWRQILGIDSAAFRDLQLQPLLSLVHPDEQPELESLRAEAIAGTRESYETQYRVRHATGSWIWIEERAKVERGRDGKAIRLAGCNLAISSRKSIRHRERLTEILEATSDYVGIADSDGRCIWRNEQLKNLRPTTEDVSIGNAHPDWALRIQMEEALPEAIEKGRWSGESAILDEAGNEIPVSQVVLAHRNESGEIECFSTVMRDISQQKASETIIKERERTYSSLAAASPVAIARIDANGIDCKYVNERWSELTGQPREAALGEGYLRFIHPDDLKLGLEAFEGFDQDDSQDVMAAHELRHVLPDGSFAWAQLHLAKERAEDGSVTGYVAQLVDIDTLKQTEQRLQLLHSRFQRVLETSSIGIWEWDFQEGKLSWDDQMLEIHGVTRAEFSGAHSDWVDRLHPDDRERVLELDLASLVGAGSRASHYRIVRPDGSVRNIFANVFVEPDESGLPLRTLGINMDVTERKEAEIALRESQNQFLRMTENVPGMIFRYLRKPDGTHEMIFVSSKCKELFEVEPEEARADVNRLFHCFHPDDIERIQDAIRESEESLEPFQEEYRVILPQRGLQWRQTFSQPTKTKSGDVVWDGVTVDITFRKQAELQLKSANEELARATRMKDQFLRNMSHELRTPLSAVLAMNEGLQHGVYGSVTGEQLSCFAVIEQSGTLLLELINEILDLAKIESGSMELELAFTDVRKLCETTLALVQQQAESKSIEIGLTISSDSSVINADAKRLQQMLLNLLNNAIKFTPEKGSVALDVKRVAATDAGGLESIQFSVSDTGIGVEESRFEDICLPFVQIDSSLSRQYEGTGLGLALVKQFAELHGGSLDIASQFGVGSCFSIQIPTRGAVGIRSPLVKERNEQGLECPTESRGQTKIARILLTEDNALVAQSTMHYLQASGFQVSLATDGREALEMAKATTPDLVLMDIQMPGVNGLECIRELRRLPEMADLPIIAMTGLAMKSDANRCLESGANCFVSKPYRMKDLVELIRRLLSESK